MDKLAYFYNDEATRETVKTYLKAVAEETAIKKVFNREDVSGVADALEIIESAFSQLDERYGQVSKSNTNNGSR